MNADLFLLPFLAGLPMAILLPLLGGLLRLRDEWLATLGLAHLATASGLAGMAAGLPVVWGAPLGALAGAVLKHFAGQRSNSIYGLMILAGWATTLLIAANTALGDALAHGVVDGQLYFAGLREALVSTITALLGLLLLPWLTPRLIRAHLFPSHETANRLPAWRWHLGFDVLAALAVAVATATLGLMATFALIFVPAWMAFRLAPDWRRSQAVALGAGIGGYCAAFLLALELDQPFGPTLVAVLLVMWLLASAWGWRPVN
jgi:zinc transport system permease protein